MVKRKHLLQVISTIIDILFLEAFDLSHMRPYLSNNQDAKVMIYQFFTR